MTGGRCIAEWRTVTRHVGQLKESGENTREKSVGQRCWVNKHDAVITSSEGALSLVPDGVNDDDERCRLSPI